MQSYEYRQKLLEAIALFLEQTPQSEQRARVLIKECQRALGIQITLNRIVWGKYCKYFGYPGKDPDFENPSTLMRK